MKKPKIVLKRSGEEAVFDDRKIYNAINAANHEVDKIHQLSTYQMEAITVAVTEQIADLPYTVSVEEIQDNKITAKQWSSRYQEYRLY